MINNKHNSSIYDYLLFSKGKYNDIYSKQWKNFISDTDIHYIGGHVLNNGKGLRPKLAIWGYLLADNEEVIADTNIMDIAVCVEALHKSSLIIDDIIDQDSFRYGKAAFHKQYSTDEAAVFPFLLIAKSFKLLAATLFRHLDSAPATQKCINLFTNVLSNMALGALQEIRSNGGDILSTPEIIQLETSILIQNSLLLGYYFGHGSDAKIAELLNEIGSKCGTLYQTLNDLEAILAPHKNIQHKGKLNNDYSRGRKNVLLSLLAGQYNISEFDFSDEHFELNEYHRQLIQEWIQNEYEEIQQFVLKMSQLIRNKACAKKLSEWFGLIFKGATLN